MASAIMRNWNRLRMAVKPDSWCSMASTSASMASTKASAAARACVGSGGDPCNHSGRWLCHSASTVANLVATVSSQGTKSGRPASPRRSNSKLWSNCCTSAATSVGARSDCATLVIRQVCMRIRPASFTAAAPPSSCQVTHSVRPMEASATSSKPAPIRTSLVDRDAVEAITWWLPGFKVCKYLLATGCCLRQLCLAEKIMHLQSHFM